jgi:hypothetical protein
MYNSVLPTGTIVHPRLMQDSKSQPEVGRDWKQGSQRSDQREEESQGKDQ